MKTAGRITATLALILSLYLLSYWILIKKDWLYKLSEFIVSEFNLEPYSETPLINAVTKAFKPIEELESIWTSIITRKHLTGSWRSAKTNDFVTLGPDGECVFQLGEFAFNGNGKYDLYEGGFSMEFPYQDQRYLIVIVLNNDPTVFGTLDQASALIGPTYTDPFDRRIDSEITLTKQAPITPTP